jgi:hypothetical protein
MTSEEAGGDEGESNGAREEPWPFLRKCCEESILSLLTGSAARMEP